MWLLVSTLFYIYSLFHTNVAVPTVACHCDAELNFTFFQSMYVWVRFNSQVYFEIPKVNQYVSPRTGT